MSVLTKILIVLLTLASIFLCGIVVTYIGNADNYKQQSETFRRQLQAAKEKEQNAIEREKESIAKSQQLEDNLNRQINSLRMKIEQLEGDIKNAEREKAALLQKVNSMADVVESTSQTAKQQTQLLENTQKELNDVQAQLIRDQKKLKDTSASLLEKMAIIGTLETEKKRLLEQKAELQAKLDGMLQPIGKRAKATPVTLEKIIAKPAKVDTTDIGLKGLVTKVDLKNSLASVSIGKADGVKVGDRFYVHRGDEYICDILIINVDAEEAVGVLELVEKQPKVGDKVTTNL